MNEYCGCACSVASVMSDCATLWTITHQAPLSMGFSRQEYWGGPHALLQGVFPTQRLNPSLASPALAGAFFTTSATILSNAFSAFIDRIM